MIGIIAAMKIEAEQIASQMKNRKSERISGIDYITGKIAGKDVVLAVCGIGKVFAAICAQTMALRFQPELIINTGVGGSLSKELNVFNVAVAESVVQHDMDTSPLGDPVGMISGINRINLPCDLKSAKKIIACAEELSIHCVPGVIASGDQFISTKEQKKRITDLFGAIACEMEGAAIGHVCFVNRIPFVVIRAISDSADGSATVDYPTFVQEAAENSAKILLKFLNL